MKKTIFTNSDIKNIIENIFKDNNEIITLEDGEETKNIPLIDYLNVKFYSWKDRQIEQEATYTPFESWLSSLNYSMNKSYGLVEIMNSELTQSPDIDSCLLHCKITFLIQSNKVNNLDYYIISLRNKYLGKPQDIVNKWGETLKSYIVFNDLSYDEEPITIQNGECVLCTCLFNISYLTEALTYNDVKTELSFDGETFYELPYIKSTWQNIFTGEAVTCQTTPTQTGQVNSSMTCVKTYAFYDFNKELTKKLDDIFWELGAYSIDGIEQTTKTTNIPVWVRIKGKYLYKDVIITMEKHLENSDFSLSSITLKPYGKRG